MSDFAEAWSARYGDTPPVGWRLREQYGGRAGSRWFRIHSLPGSKRYPDTPEDLAAASGGTFQQWCLTIAWQ